MTSSVSVLADDLGPRGKRRVQIISGIAAFVAALIFAIAIGRLSDKGQFAWELWEPFTQWTTIQFYWGGLMTTLKAAAIAMTFALVIGALMALGRLAQNRPVRWLAGLYVEFFRAEPLLLLILFSSLVLPEYGLDWEVLWYLVLGLTLYNSAMLAEVFRAGILSLDRGQSEAARSLGMTYWQAMLIVVVPQAARRMAPATVSQLVTLLKDTSLGFVIAYEELLRRARISGEFFHNVLQSYFVVAVVYFLINFALSSVARWLENRRRTIKAAPVVVPPGIPEASSIIN